MSKMNEELMPDQKIIHGDGGIPDTSFDEFDKESTWPVLAHWHHHVIF